MKLIINFTTGILPIPYSLFFKSGGGVHYPFSILNSQFSILKNDRPGGCCCFKAIVMVQVSPFSILNSQFFNSHSGGGGGGVSISQFSTPHSPFSILNSSILIPVVVKNCPKFGLTHPLKGAKTSRSCCRGGDDRLYL
jgi:hypothetical protein